MKILFYACQSVIFGFFINSRKARDQKYLKIQLNVASLLCCLLRVHGTLLSHGVTGVKMNVNQSMYKEKLWKLFRKAEETITKATLKI